ncbi:MAG: GNAT family N-acetyltransferase [Bacteroidota bacterium]
MQIQHTTDGKNGSFFVGEKEKPVAEMTYRMRDAGTMIIEHTEVSDELRGKNIGYQLVETAVEYARASNIKIIPLCPFANSVFKKKPELHDVLSTQ